MNNKLNFASIESSPYKVDKLKAVLIATEIVVENVLLLDEKTTDKAEINVIVAFIQMLPDSYTQNKRIYHKIQINGQTNC